MDKNQDVLNQMQKKNLEAAVKLAQLSIENSRRIVQLQVETAKSLLDEGVVSTQALTGAKDPQEFVDVRARYTQQATEKMLACAREIAQITASTQAEVGRIVAEQLTAGSQDMLDAFQKIFAGMPISDRNTANSIQTAMDTAKSAFELMTRVSAQAFQNFTQTPQQSAAPKTTRK